MAWHWPAVRTPAHLHEDRSSLPRDQDRGQQVGLNCALHPAAGRSRHRRAAGLAGRLLSARRGLGCQVDSTQGRSCARHPTYLTADVDPTPVVDRVERSRDQSDLTADVDPTPVVGRAERNRDLTAHADPTPVVDPCQADPFVGRRVRRASAGSRGPTHPLHRRWPAVPDAYSRPRHVPLNSYLRRTDAVAHRSQADDRAAGHR